MISYIHAILAINPNAKVTCDGDTIVSWESDSDQPTEEEIIRKKAELEYKEQVESEYKQKRKNSYPSIVDQLDKIFHEGVDAWKADIQAIKDKYPKQEIDSDTRILKMDSAWDNHDFATKSKAYKTAIERLDQYELSVGKPAVEAVYENITLENSWDSAGNPIVISRLVTKSEESIDPLPLTISVIDSSGDSANVTNPLITKDNEERAVAQAVIDATPQAVIDEYNS